MSKPDSGNDRPWTFESFWQAAINDAREGNTREARNVMRECLSFLKGNGFVYRSNNWDESIPISKKGYAPKGYLPEPLSSFLIESLEAAMQVKSKEVGKAMRIGNPPKTDTEYHKNLKIFLNHYNYLMSSHEGSEFSESKERAMALEEIASLMKVDLRTVQRYFNDTGGASIGDFEYYWEYNPYEDEED
jgi:hypothetical protein